MKSGIDVKELMKGGVVKLKEGDLFSMWVKTSCCNLSSMQLRDLADITERYARGIVLFSTRQIPIIPFVKLADVDEVKRRLSAIYLELDRCGPRVRNINVCYDDSICSDALIDPIPLAEKLENYFNVPMNHKVKIGVAGCKKDCIISRVLNDIAFIGVSRDGKQGYDVYFGGRLGVKPAVGTKMADSLSPDECQCFTQNAFELLGNEGKEEERCADILDRLGADRIKLELIRGLERRADLKTIECQTRLREQLADKVILRIRAILGEVTSTQLMKIADIAERYGKGFVHFAVRGSPEIPGIEEEDMVYIGEELRRVGMQILDKRVDNLQSCFGSYCTESNADPQSLLREIEAKIEEIGLDNLDIKISAAGCPNSCGIAQLNDIGFYGIVEPEVDVSNCIGCQLCIPVCKRSAITMKDDLAVIDMANCKLCGQCIAVCPFDGIVSKRKGFAVFIGGREGEDPRLGKLISEFLSEEEALQFTDKCLKLVKEIGTGMATIIDEIGANRVKQMLAPNNK
jgi:dissimilatory sulfite reductase (desulfoviridin) alpha/beta subunit